MRDGEPAFTPSLAALVVDEFRRVSRADWAEPALTARENEVIRLVAKGYTYREISTKTVQNHVRNVLTKLQLHMRY